MDVSVRFIPSQISVVDGVYLASGSKPALCIIDGDYAQCVVNESLAIETVTYPRRFVEKGALVPGYDPERFIQRMKEFNKEITPEAQQLFNYTINPHSPPKAVISKSVKKSTQNRKSTLISELATQYKTTPPTLRKFFRSQGLRAPYDDRKKLTALIKKSLAKYLQQKESKDASSKK